MEIVVTGRHVEVPERFRRHAVDKLAKVSQFAPRAIRLDVEVSHEPNKRQSSTCERVEITCVDRGPVIRAEACAQDPYAALDLAAAKLLERLRRARDRRRVHYGRHTPATVRQGSTPPSDVEESGGSSAQRSPTEPGALDEEAVGESPIVIREKLHVAKPMSLDQALYEMELVGHDFYLFVDEASRRPSVVYRRRGWSYGVIGLDVAVTEAMRPGASASSDGYGPEPGLAGGGRVSSSTTARTG